MSTKQRMIWSITMYGLYLWAYALLRGPLDADVLLVATITWTAVWWLVLPKELPR